MLNYLFFSVIGYLSGSVLYSHLIAKKFCGIDITVISDDGNPGAANVLKYGDLKYGIIAMILDIFKGILPISAAAYFLDTHNLLFTIILIAPVLGHAFSAFSKFRGGKSIAVSFGCLLGLVPYSIIVLFLAIFLVIFTFIIVIKPNSLRCIVSYACFSLFCLRFVNAASIRYGCILISAIVIFKHIVSFEHEKPELHIIPSNWRKHRN